MKYLEFTLLLLVMFATGWFWFSAVSAIMLFRAWHTGNHSGLADLAVEGETVFLDPPANVKETARYISPEQRGGGRIVSGIVVIVGRAAPPPLAESLLSEGWAILCLIDNAASPEKWVKWVHKKKPGIPAAVYGYGIGANRVLHSFSGKKTGSQRNAEDSLPTGIIADCPAPFGDGSYEDTVRRVLGGRVPAYGPLFFSKMLSAARYGVKKGATGEKAVEDLAGLISRIPVPVLLFERNQIEGSASEAKNTRIMDFLRRVYE